LKPIDHNQNSGFEVLRRNASLVILVAGLVLVLVGCTQQSAKWEFARAMNLAEEGQLVEAIELMEVALEHSPDDFEIKLQLAELLAENGQGELGIGHCDECLELRPNDPKARQVRSSCLQYLGRFDESLVEYKKSLSGTVTRSPYEQNNLAYFRALANKELDKAARDIQLAISTIEGESWGCRYLVPLQVRTVVAAGLISRHVGTQNDVLCALNEKIDEYKRKMAVQSDLIRARVALEIQIEFPFNERTENELLNVRGNREVQKNCIALLCATRALVLNDLGRHCESDKDRVQVEELGFDFDTLATELPTDESCLEELKHSFFLDTRGFISGLREWKTDTEEAEFFVSSGNVPNKKQIPDAALNQGSSKSKKLNIPPSSYEEALRDLDFAVLAARYSQLALDSPLYNRPEISAREIKLNRRLAKRMTAVLLYHRMNVHLRGTNQQAAEDDQRRIEQLGLHPDSSLF